MVFKSTALEEWSFTQVGGGDGTKDGEWLQVSSFPTTVHVELLKLKRIPDPVRVKLLQVLRSEFNQSSHHFSSLVFTSGTFNVRRHLI